MTASQAIARLRELRDEYWKAAGPFRVLPYKPPARLSLFDLSGRYIAESAIALPALLDAAEACGELLNAIDAGRMRQTVGVTGQTMDAQLRASVYDRVPAYPVEQAREKHMYAIAALQALANTTGENNA